MAREIADSAMHQVRVTPARPKEIKWLCLWILIWTLLNLIAGGVMMIIGQVPKGVHPSLNLADLAAFFAALGLWRFWKIGRHVALLMIWCWMIFSVITLCQIFLPGFSVSPVPALFAIGPDFLRPFLVVPFFAVQLWQYTFLKRPDIKKLYDYRFYQTVTEGNPAVAPSA